MRMDGRERWGLLKPSHNEAHPAECCHGPPTPLKPASTPGTGEDVQNEYAAQQPGPSKSLLRGQCCAKRSCVLGAQGDVLPQDERTNKRRCLTRSTASQKRKHWSTSQTEQASADRSRTPRISLSIRKVLGVLAFSYCLPCYPERRVQHEGAHLDSIL